MSNFTEEQHKKYEGHENFPLMDFRLLNKVPQGRMLGNHGTGVFSVFKQVDFINLPSFNVYVKLLIDGMASRPFSGKIGLNT